MSQCDHQSPVVDYHCLISQSLNHTLLQLTKVAAAVTLEILIRQQHVNVAVYNQIII